MSIENENVNEPQNHQSCQTSVMVSVGNFVKEVGSDWFKVLRVEGRNVYLDYDDGLNCLDIDDIIEWKH